MSEDNYYKEIKTYYIPKKVESRKPVCCFWTDINGTFRHIDGGPAQYYDYPGPDRTIDAVPPLKFRR